ncbi:MAG: uracil-DNA glycosylase [Alphaproteobacteria bacterium]|nr:uracil-DNA glycosylase [Alphaproteobacteria bacterium]
MPRRTSRNTPDRAAPIGAQTGSPGSPTPHEPPSDCPLCPRLHTFRHENRTRYPTYFNDPVPFFGRNDARLLIVGLAPGLHGANRTGRPFTGDHAGLLLYGTLKKLGLARGTYHERSDDGLELIGCAIANAVRCVPPGNKPLPSEVTTCRQFLTATIRAVPNLGAILALGKIAHDSICTALSVPKKDHVFGHGATHTFERIALLSSYHCSRLNTNTGVLTAPMFEAIVSKAKSAAGL